MRKARAQHLLSSSTDAMAVYESKKGPASSKTPLLDRIAVTVREAAVLIGSSDKQIRKALYARELPAAKLGKAYSIGVDDLRKWFDEKKRTVTA